MAGISKESTTEKCDSTFTSEGSATCVSSVVCGHISFLRFYDGTGSIELTPS